MSQGRRSWLAHRFFISIILLLGGPTARLYAQVGGTGWKEYHPSSDLDRQSSGAAAGGYTNVGGVETFTIRQENNTHRQRSERRLHNTYGQDSGLHQFEGFLRPVRGDGTSFKQTWLFLMIVGYPQNGGELHQHSQTFLKDHVFGKWIRVNTIHDTSNNTADIYLDGTRVLKMTDRHNPSWHDQYGVYNCQSGTCQAQWKNVRVWRK
jgi:hypothetical protein